MNRKPKKSRSNLRAVLRIAFYTLILVPLLYLLAAVIGAFVPRNASWQQPSQGVTIFVRDNGVHVDLVLPASANGIDLYRLVPPAHMPIRRRPVDGWRSDGDSANSIWRRRAGRTLPSGTRPARYSAAMP